MRLLLVALLLAGCATQSKLGTDLDALLTKYESEGFSGTVLVAKDDRVVLHKGYGFADSARGIRNDKETLYEIASLNKTFTAAAILQLEARGKLRTTDLLSQHFGPFPAPKDQATIHHLATHMAGLVRAGSDTGPGEDREHFIEMVKQLPAESVPGARYRYTNAGYSVLAAIIEKVSGVSYESYVRDNLFSDFYMRGQPMPRPMAFGYLGAPPAVVVPPPMAWGVRGAGGMIASTGALYRWYRWLQRNPDMKKMFEDRPEEEGYAWHVERDEKGRRMIHKGGGMPQYASQIIHYPDDGIVIIWISNDLQKRWRKDLNSGIAEIALR